MSLNKKELKAKNTPMDAEDYDEEESLDSRYASFLISFFGVILVMVTFPFSACLCIKMVQVIFNLCLFNS